MMISMLTAKNSNIIGKYVHGINPTAREYDWAKGKVRYGVIPMDYPELPKDSDLIAKLIGTNM